MKNYSPIMMYLGSLSVFLAFFFPLASPKEWTHYTSTINWIWSFSFHENFSDCSNFLFGINIFTNLLILICPMMVILNIFFMRTRKISKEIYEKQIFTYSTTILVLTINMLIVLPYLHLHTIEISWFTSDLWSYYYPNFGLIGLFLGVALISLGVLFSLRFRDVKLYQILIIIPCVCIFIVNPSYYDLQGLLTSFITIILIFFIYSYFSEKLSIRFLVFITIFCVLSWVSSRDTFTYAAYLIVTSYFWNFQSLLPFYLPFIERFYRTFYFPVIMFFAFLFYLYLRKKPDVIVREPKIEQSFKEPLKVKNIFYTRRLEDIIYDYLNKNKGRAFTSRSIYNRSEEIKELDLTISDIKKILDNLTVWDKIGSHEKEGEKFYFALDDIQKKTIKIKKKFKNNYFNIGFI